MCALLSAACQQLQRKPHLLSELDPLAIVRRHALEGALAGSRILLGVAAESPKP
jgi:hypothetical protein